MKKYILTYGFIGGAIAAALMVVTVPLSHRIGFDQGYLLGYAAIVLSSLMVYFGVRSYRDHAAGGQISFGKAFLVGLAITTITCVCYVICWEIIYYNFMPDFMDKYSAYMIAKARAKGASPAALQAQLQQLQRAKEMYANPLINAAMTFIEPFPVGLAMALISAGVLRKRPQASVPAGEVSPA